MLFIDSINVKCPAETFSPPEFMPNCCTMTLMAGSPTCSSSTMSWGKVRNSGFVLNYTLLSLSRLKHSDLFSPFSVWLHQTRIGLSLYDVAGQGYLRESVSAVLFFLSGVVVVRPQVWLLWLNCRIWRTTSWSWSPRCLSLTGWRSLSTLSTSALLFESSFSSWTHFEQVSQNLGPRLRPRETVSTSVCVISIFLFSGKIKIQDILACSFLDDLLEVYMICFLSFTSPLSSCGM